jgi:hypothetical protein
LRHALRLLAVEADSGSTSSSFFIFAGIIFAFDPLVELFVRGNLLLHSSFNCSLLAAPFILSAFLSPVAAIAGCFVINDELSFSVRYGN